MLLDLAIVFLVLAVICFFLTLGDSYYQLPEKEDYYDPFSGWLP